MFNFAPSRISGAIFGPRRVGLCSFMNIVFWADGSFVVFAVVFAVVVVVEDKGAFVLWLVGSRLWVRLFWRPPPPPFLGGISRKI